MKAELFDKWIAALESGEHRQAHLAAVRYTETGIRRCCLNVAAYCAVGEEADWMDTVPCVRVIEMSREWQDIFVRLNDDERRTFSEIAAYARAHRSEIVS